tara:strand:+ start:606 stop:890 length:285 start_codon:yes stop_codon:yes gene_type:complete
MNPPLINDNIKGKTKARRFSSLFVEITLNTRMNEIIANVFNNSSGLFSPNGIRKMRNEKMIKNKVEDTLDTNLFIEVIEQNCSRRSMMYTRKIG